MPVLCVVGGIGIVMLSLFFYLLNTARKKTAPAPAAGRKNYTPIYVSIADKPDSIMRGMDNFVRKVQTTETAGDKWRWIPMFIFLAGVGLSGIDLLLLLFGYFSIIFTGGGVALWIASFVMARSLRKSDSAESIADGGSGSRNRTSDTVSPSVCSSKSGSARSMRRISGLSNSGRRS